LQVERNTLSSRQKTKVISLQNIVIFLFVLFSNLTISAQIPSDEHSSYNNSDIFPSPILLYGETAFIKPDSLDTIRGIVSLGSGIPECKTICTGNDKAFLLICSGQILEFSKNSCFNVDLEQRIFYVFNGEVIIHKKSKFDNICYKFITDSVIIKYAGKRSVFVSINDTTVWLTEKSCYSYGKYITQSIEKLRDNRKDANYIFELVNNKLLPANSFDFDLPSKRPKKFNYNFTGYGGVVSYKGTNYIYGGGLLKLKYINFGFVYDLWLASSVKGKYFKETWNEWSDLVDHIHYIQLFNPANPFYLRAGILKRITFAQGLLVDNYCNAVFLPFDYRTGLDLRLNLPSFRSYIFVNDISQPTLVGSHINWGNPEKFLLGFSYVGDFNQLVDIQDRDRDSYPDRIDPEPDDYNYPEDSVIIEANLQSLDEIGFGQLHSLSFNMFYSLWKIWQFNGSVAGEAVVLSTFSDKPLAGMTFPNLLFSFKYFEIGLGFDTQSPGFVSGVFDRFYEGNKARFVKDEDGNLKLVVLGGEISSKKGWLYGWNTSLNINIPGWIETEIKYKDIYHAKLDEKYFSCYLDFKYPVAKQITKIAFYIEQKGVKKLFWELNDQQSWGFDFSMKPHRSLKVNIRFRKSYIDENGDGKISSGETKINLSRSINLDGTYWWRLFLKWYRNRKEKSKAEGKVNPNVEINEVSKDVIQEEPYEDRSAQDEVGDKIENKIENTEEPSQNNDIVK
jgi:hypothetical protein